MATPVAGFGRSSSTGREEPALAPVPATSAPSMGAVLRVKVPSKGGHPNRSEPQLREGDRPWEGSGKRNRGPMYKNRIRGGDGRGERACTREAPVTKGPTT